MKGSAKIRMLFSIAWLVMTVSLGVWWWVLGIRQAKTISEISVTNESYNELARVSWMLKWEGSFFISLLTLGGITLTVLSYRDQKRSKLITDFFSTVTHEMKTPLASLQLQIEALLEDSKNKDLQVRLKKLWKENNRIESQMANAFYLASLMQGEPLFVESVTPKEIKESFDHKETNLKWIFASDPNTKLFLDKKAFESILKNLVENSKRHGNASSVEIHVQMKENTVANHKICFCIQDNGKGFSGNWKQLGVPFLRHKQTSGTGIGLYIVKKLVEKMKGDLFFKNTEVGFLVQMEFDTYS